MNPRTQYNDFSTTLATEADQELLHARGLIYTLIAAAFTEPRTERFDLLRQPVFQALALTAADILTARSAEEKWTEIGPGEASPMELPVSPVFESLATTGESAQEEYATVFGYTMTKDCPPYAVEFCPQTDMFYRSQRLADVAGFYLAFGLDRTRNNREREDHLVYLAEFMAFLLAKQSYALENGHPDEQRQLIITASRRFFADHCGWWWPAFACRLQAKVGVAHFYGRTVQLLRHFTAWERHWFRLPSFRECPEPQVPAFEPEGSCFSCTVNPS